VNGDIGQGVAVPLKMGASLAPDIVGLIDRPNAFGLYKSGVGAAPRVVVLAQGAAVCSRTPETPILLGYV